MSKVDLLLRASDSTLLVVDLQEKFRPGVAGIQGVIGHTQSLVRGAIRLGIPVVATEQYPKALGQTVAEVRGLLPDSQVYFPKLCFSAYGCEPLKESLSALAKRQVVVVGLETHVCVLQTCLELIADTFSVFVVVDAVSSRKDSDRDAALKRLEKHGAELVTTEMVLFEWLRVAGTPEFKELQALIK